MNKNLFQRFPLFFFSLFFLGLIFKAQRPVMAFPYDHLLATVNEDAISDLMFRVQLHEEYLVRNLKEATPKEAKTLEMIAARKLLESALLNSEARILKINIGDDQISSEVDAYTKARHMTEGDLESFLVNNRMTMTAFKKDLSQQIAKRILVQQFVNTKINTSDERLRDYYNRTYSKGQKVIHARNFSIALPAQATLQDIDNRVKLMQTYVHYTTDGTAGAKVLQDIFEQKKNYSTSEFTLGLNDMIPQFTKGLQDLVVGQYSKIIVSPQGVHLVKVLDITTSPSQSFGEVRDKLTDEYYRSEFNRFYYSYLETLEARASITYLDPGFEALIKEYKLNPALYRE